MKYLHDPDRPTQPILDASPREIDAHRDSLRRYLRASWKFNDADVEDAVQNVVIVACRLIAEKRVRGAYSITPENRLQSLLRVIVRNVAANIKRAARNRSRVVVNDIGAAEFVPDAHSLADAQIEAHETLDAIRADDQKSVQLLLRVVMGNHPVDIAHETGKHVNTIHSAVQRGRNKVMKKHRNGRR